MCKINNNYYTHSIIDFGMSIINYDSRCFNKKLWHGATDHHPQSVGIADGIGRRHWRWYGINII